MSFAYGFGLPHYQPLSGGFSPASLFTGGVQGAWYDPSDSGPTGTGGVGTLFSDRAGTTPCGTPGAGAVVPVGLMLDKSQGLTLGPNLTDPLNFTAPLWTVGANVTNITANSFETTGPATGLNSTTLLQPNKWYQITMTYTKSNTAAFSVRFDATNDVVSFTATSGTVTGIGFSSATDNIYFRAASATTITITSISIRELPGNHAIAANDTTARPELSARVNLLTYSEQFENAAWDKLNGVTISQNAAIAPDGTTTADKLIAPNSTGTGRVLRQALTSGVNGVSYVSSFYAKFVSGEFSWVRALGTDAGVVWFDIQNGVRGTVTGANTTGTITSVGNGWYRCVITSTANSTNIYSYLNPVDADGSSTTTGDGSKGVLIWGADLRPTNIGTQIPAYQRVADANTYDSAGFPRYLKCNGTSSAMSTPANLNLSATDKVTVFAGVRQVAAGSQQLVEFSADINANNGAFSMPKDAVAPAVWTTASRGTATTSASSSAIYAAPITTVNTGLYDIALSADEVKLRINSAQVATSGAGSAGTGNFGTYPLFIGARNTSSLFLNGDIYSLIVVGSAVSAGSIAATETWVNGKVGGAY